MRIVAFVCVLLVAGITRPMAGQSRIGVELMNSYYRGTAVDTSGNPHARPGSALMYTLHRA